MEKIKVIEQSGKHTCLICKNTFAWGFKLNRIVGIRYSVPYEGEITEFEDIPSRHVNFVTKGIDEVEFSITCPKCRYVHVTERMKLTKE